MGGLAGVLRFSDGVNVRDQIVPVLGLLETAESHLGSWDVFLGVFEVFELEQLSVCAPRHQKKICSSIPECPPSTQSPCSCLHPCMRNPRLDQSFARTNRGGWDRSCYPGKRPSCGIVRIVSELCQLPEAPVEWRRHHNTLKRLAPFLSSPVVRVYQHGFLRRARIPAKTL